MTGKWDVTILRGDPGLEVWSAPVAMGQEVLILAKEGRAQGAAFLVYKGVELVSTSQPSGLDLRSDLGTHRSMVHPAFDFDRGFLRVDGFEEREDGGLIVAAWEAVQARENAETNDGA